MRFAFICIVVFGWMQSAFAQPAAKEYVVYFEVPLVCGAKETIGCGLLAKPLLLDLEATGLAREAWLNREGTYIAIALGEPYLPLWQLLKKTKVVFDRHSVEFAPVKSVKKQEELRSTFREQGKWYRCEAVDSLSWEEAEWLARNAIRYLEGYLELPKETQEAFRNEIGQHIGNSLVSLKSIEELDEMKIHAGLLPIAERYLGPEGVRKSIENYHAEQQVNFTSTFTCPKCGYRSTVTLPTDRCIMEYKCENCKKVIKHKKGDCCVFCSYGDVKCPTVDD